MIDTVSKNQRIQIAAAIVGNALEWYDFLVFGFMLAVISRLFFPQTSELVALLYTSAIFGVGFFMRPVGGIVLGVYADRRGRKAALQLVIGLMTVAIAVIAFAPVYASVGIAAPLLILLARLLQGFATGGEFASATALIFEKAPDSKRGFYGSFQMFGQSLAALLGASLGQWVTGSFTEGEIESWAWRIPFIVGMIIAPVGLWIRRYLDESALFEQDRQSSGQRHPLARVVTDRLRDTLVALALTVFATVSFYVVLIYMPTFASKVLRMPLHDALQAQSIALIFLTITVPVAGYYTDRLGAKMVSGFAALMTLVLAYPLIAWLTPAPSFEKLLVVQLVLCVLVGVYFGPFASMVATQFPTAVRATGMSVAYNLAVMIFGGFAPFILTWFINKTGNLNAPAWYILVGAIIGMAGIVFSKAHFRDSHE